MSFQIVVMAIRIAFKWMHRYCSQPPPSQKHRNILPRLLLWSRPIEARDSRMQRRDTAGGSRRAQFSNRHRRSSFFTSLPVPYCEVWDSAPSIEIWAVSRFARLSWATERKAYLSARRQSSSASTRARASRVPKARQEWHQQRLCVRVGFLDPKSLI